MGTTLLVPPSSTLPPAKEGRTGAWRASVWLGACRAGVMLTLLCLGYSCAQDAKFYLCPPDGVAQPWRSSVASVTPLLPVWPKRPTQQSQRLQWWVWTSQVARVRREGHMWQKRHWREPTPGTPTAHLQEPQQHAANAAGSSGYFRENQQSRFLRELAPLQKEKVCVPKKTCLQVGFHHAFHLQWCQV